MTRLSSFLRFTAIVLTAWAAGSLCAHAAQSSAVARIENRVVTLEELDRLGGREIYDATQQLHQARVRALYQLLSQDVLAREAKSLSLSVDDLLASHVTTSQSQISENEIDRFLASRPNMKADDGKTRQQVAFFIAGTKRAEERNRLLTRLFKKYDVRVSLENPPTPPAEDIHGAKSPSIGNPRAPIQITVFSDYLCPYCRDLSHTLDQLLKRYPNDVQIIYRHFPVHAESGQWAQAALCADDQGKFPEYHALLFSSAAAKEGGYEMVAEQLGLEKKAFDECMKSQRHARRVQADTAEGNRLDIKGTPTLFINGMRMRGLQELNALTTQIESIKRAQAEAARPESRTSLADKVKD